MSIAQRVLPHLLVVAALISAAPPAAAQADIELISQGREVTLEEHLVPGKLVIFDFFADWCAPCRQLTPRLERMTEQNPDAIALRKVDVIDWSSPVSRQHGVGSLPYLVLYGPEGQRLAAGDANRVLRVLGEHLGGGPAALGAPWGGPAVPLPVWVTLAAALVAGSLVVRGLQRARATTPSSKPAGAAPSGDSPRIWFALRSGGVDGPYSVEQLAALRGNRTLAAETRVRRRGEATWRRLDDVVGQR